MEKDVGQRQILICKNITDEQNILQIIPWQISQKTSPSTLLLWLYFMSFDNGMTIELKPKNFCDKIGISRRTFDTIFKNLIELGFLQQVQTNNYTFYDVAESSKIVNQKEYYYTYIISFLENDKDEILKVGKTNNLERRFSELSSQYHTSHIKICKVFSFNSEDEALNMENYLRDKFKNIQGAQYIPQDRFKGIAWSDNILL